MVGQPDNRLRQVDALRGIAILAVLFEHWAGELSSYVPIGAGTLGVSLFFTLSGFLITGIILEDRARQTGGNVLVRFYIRRFFRLVPAFYAVVVALALLNVQSLATDWPWHLAYLSDFHQALGGQRTVFWSLAVEEQFYLFWPLIVLATPQRWVGHVAGGMVVFAVVFKIVMLAFGYWTHFFLPPGQMEYLGVGCLLAVLCFRDGKRNRFDWFTDGRLRAFGVIAVTAFLVACIEWLVTRNDLFRLLVMNTLCAAFYTWIVLMAARGWSGWIGQVLNLMALQYLGRISYGVYLVHNFMPDVIEKLTGPMPKYQEAPLVVLLTFGLCALSWRFYEKPLISFGHYLSDAFFASSRASV